MSVIQNLNHGKADLHIWKCVFPGGDYAKNQKVCTVNLSFSNIYFPHTGGCLSAICNEVTNPQNPHILNVLVGHVLLDATRWRLVERGAAHERCSQTASLKYSATFLWESRVLVWRGFQLKGQTPLRAVYIQTKILPNSRAGPSKP